MLSSWFLYAEKDNYIVDAWCEGIRKFWTQNTSTDDYFWFHHLFGDLYADDPKFKAIWDATPKILARGPHRFNRAYSSEITQEVKDVLEAKVDYVYKLTYKYEGILPENSIFHYMLRLKKMPIANKQYWTSDLFPELCFVHIGKCGGTYLLELFKYNLVFLEQVHLNKIPPRQDLNYIIWLRHPVTRFVSAFYFNYDLIRVC